MYCCFGEYHGIMMPIGLLLVWKLFVYVYNNENVVLVQYGLKT